MKRLLDIVLILLSLPIMLPVALIVAIAIKLDSPGPVLYWSERIGRNGRPFIMPKFRSMSVGAPIVEAENSPMPAATSPRLENLLEKPA